SAAASGACSFFFSSRRRHTRFSRDWSSDVCSSDLGTVFDSSYQRGQPAEFPVGGVIAGWTEALQLMGVGSKWRLYVPSELAYGAQGVGSIPPHSVLVFDVELLAVL